MSVISNLSENEAHDALNQMVINFSLNTWNSIGIGLTQLCM